MLVCQLHYQCFFTLTIYHVTICFVKGVLLGDKPIKKHPDCKALQLQCFNLQLCCLVQSQLNSQTYFQLQQAAQKF